MQIYRLFMEYLLDTQLYIPAFYFKIVKLNCDHCDRYDDIIFIFIFVIFVFLFFDFVLR